MENFRILFQPFNATRITASSIDARVKELMKDNGHTSSRKEGFWEEYEVMHCG